MENNDKIIIKADDVEIGSFPYSKRRSHKHLFNLSGIELIHAESGNRIDRRRLYEDSLEIEAD